MKVPMWLKRGFMAATTCCLLASSAFTATDATNKVTSVPEGVTYGTEKQYAVPANTSEYATFQNAAGCVGLLILLGAIPVIINRVGKAEKKKEDQEKVFIEKAHKEAVHRIIDTKQKYRAYVERDTHEGYNLVVVNANGYWTDNFPKEEDALRFAYENGIEID